MGPEDFLWSRIVEYPNTQHLPEEVTYNGLSASPTQDVQSCKIFGATSASSSFVGLCLGDCKNGEGFIEGPSVREDRVRAQVHEVRQFRHQERPGLWAREKSPEAGNAAAT